MDKTTVVLAYVNSLQFIGEYNNIVWVSVLNNLPEDFINQLSNENTGFEPDSSKDLIGNFNITKNRKK